MSAILPICKIITDYQRLLDLEQTTKETIKRYMPDCFKELYPNTRVIIDCTEIRTQQPSSLVLVLNSQLYSHYKGTYTFKCLIGIAPHGAVTFVSSLYTGCMSDVEITKLSGILDLLEPEDGRQGVYLEGNA